MTKFNWNLIAKELMVAIGGKKNVKSFQYCATRFRVYVIDDKKVNRKKLESIKLVKGIKKESSQWQVIFGVGTVNKVYDAFNSLYTNQKTSNTQFKKEPQWNKTISFSSNVFSILRKSVRFFADIFIPLIPIFIAGGLSLALTSLIGQISKSETATSISKFFELIGGGILGSLPAFVGYTAMKKFGGTPMLGLGIGIIMVAPSLLNGWISSDNYVITGFGATNSEILHLKTNYIIDNYPNINDAWIKAGGFAATNKTLVDYAADNHLNIAHAFALFPSAPRFFSFSFVGYQAQVFPTLGIIGVAYWTERILKRISHESIAIISVPLGTVIIALFLGFLFIGPIGRYVGLGITYAFQYTYKYTNWPGFGLGGALLGAAYPFLVLTGLHQGFIPVEASLIADTTITYGHSFTWITAIASVSNVAQGMVGLTLGILLWKKSKKASSKAVTGALSANLGITEPILFGVNLPIKYGIMAASIASAFGGYYVGMTHTVANSLGSASWLGLVQFDFRINSNFIKYINDYGFNTTPGLDKIPPIINEAIALSITTIAAVIFTVIFTKTFGKKSFNEFVKAN